MKKAKKNIIEFIQGTKIMFQEFFNKKTNKMQRANMWSFTRLVLVIPIIITVLLYFFTKNNDVLVITGILALLGGITDYFDGKSARKYNSCSEYGKKLDQIADKTFCGTLSISLTLIKPIYIITFIMELLIILINTMFNLKFKDINNDSNIVGKIKQWPLFLLLFVSFFSVLNPIIYKISLVLLILTTIMQLATIISYIDKHTKEIKHILTIKR